MRRLPVLALLLLLGCRPLYLPPVPEPLQAQERMALDAVAEQQQGRPLLQLTVKRLPIDGWLAVQWYAPQNRQVASESIWLSREDVGEIIVVALPPEVEVSAGRWRAVLSMNGTVVRQVSVDVPAARQGSSDE